MKHIEYINSFALFGNEGGYKPGLERMNALLEAFDNPQKDLNVIHVAGSNGKGSTIAFIESIYKNSGYKVGVYSSPHLHRVNERIRVNAEDIKEDELRAVVEEIRPVIEEISSTNVGQPSYFEVLTLIAFIFFHRRKAEIVLLETGLGGRLDATNIVNSPLLSIITSISMEHKDILGSSLEEIAGEKAGIIKTEVPLVTAFKSEKAFKVIKDKAEVMNSRVFNIQKFHDFFLKDVSLAGQTFVLEDREYKTGLKGIHQVENAVTAIKAVQLLQDYFPVKESSIKTALQKAYIPARIEVLSKNPLIICDGAHNPEGISSLVSFLEKLKESKNEDSFNKIFMVFSCFKNKDYREMLNIIVRAFGDSLYLVLSKNKSSRSISPKKLYDYLTQHNLQAAYTIKKSIGEAVKLVLRKAEKNDLICITGSIYTAAEAEDILKNAINQV